MRKLSDCRVLAVVWSHNQVPKLGNIHKEESMQVRKQTLFKNEYDFKKRKYDYM